MRMAKSERSLKITAYTVSIIFALMILFPLAYILSCSLKDNMKIYEVPPRIIPESTKSVSIIADYSEFAEGDIGKLLDAVLQDAVLSMFSTVYELNRDSIFEVKFYGILEGRTIFYSRAHKQKLQLEMDYGVYAQSVVKRDVLVTEERYKRAMDSIGYEFDIDGLKKNYNAGKLTKNSFDITIKEFLRDKYAVAGDVLGTVLETNNILMLENFKYYYKLPAYVYRDYAIVKKYSFFAFVINTCIVIGWAILTQTILCSLTAFGISRLFSKRASNILLMYFLATMMIPFVSIMVPQFIMFKNMGLYNNYGALLVPFLLPFGFYVYLFKGFFDRLPGSLFEAAKIDGASNFYCYLKICMPLSKPIISLIALQTFLSNWNDFFWAWMVTEKQSLWTLNVALYNLSKNSAIKQNFIMGLSIVTIIPVILLTVIFSDQIKQSIASSGIKG